MAAVKRLKTATGAISIHEDLSRLEAETVEGINGYSTLLDDDSVSSDSNSTDEEVEQSITEDMLAFEKSFQGIDSRYKLINRIGEGTFSTVYKAEDLLYDTYKNEWNDEQKENNKIEDEMKKQCPPPRKTRFVAIKKIYVTSSPMRILNELELLHDLRHSANVCPLITAFRHHDQVVAILPYFQHMDFREYYRDMTIQEMKTYFHSLLTAVQAVHEHSIIHRDIKPTNFLYSPVRKQGVLVDFGLAEREGTDWSMCNCQLRSEERAERIQNSIYYSIRNQYRDAGQALPTPQYCKDDPRHPRRANRAGTRGFRAPEVLLKCTAQTCQIDIWSCGIILLTLLSRRFPFFHSADDIDAFIELTCIFGKRRMNEISLRHGQVLHTNILSLSDHGHSWEKIIHWCLGRKKDQVHTAEEMEAMKFMDLCLALDPGKRITAREALMHSFIQGRTVAGH